MMQQNCLRSARRALRQASDVHALRSAFQRNTDRSVALFNLSAVRDRAAIWRQELPGIDPYYAVKCNSDVEIVKTAYEEGFRFDCASVAEMELVTSEAVGCDIEHTIFANPMKASGQIRRARELGTKLTVVDSVDEVSKLAREHPDCKALLRLATDDRNAKCRFSAKYGALQTDTRRIIRHAKALGIDLVGVSYHVGSGGSDTGVHDSALALCRAVFDEAADEGVHMSIVDIGGGFPGADCKVDAGRVVSLANEHGHAWPVTAHDVAAMLGAEVAPGVRRQWDGADHFRAVAHSVRAALDRHFPDRLEPSEGRVAMARLLAGGPASAPLGSGVYVMAEPGRYLVEECVTIVSPVLGVKREGVEAMDADETFDETAPDADSPVMRVYAGESAYGSFNCTHYDKAVVMPVHLPGSLLQSEASPLLDEQLLGRFEQATAMLPTMPAWAADRASMTPAVPASAEAAQLAPPELAALGASIAASSAAVAASSAAAFGLASWASAATAMPSRALTTGVATSHGVARLFGNTCDGLDILMDRVPLPLDVAEGDALLFEAMGAYTTAAASRFNGFDLAERVYLR